MKHIYIQFFLLFIMICFVEVSLSAHLDSNFERDFDIEEAQTCDNSRFNNQKQEKSCVFDDKEVSGFTNVNPANQPVINVLSEDQELTSNIIIDDETLNTSYFQFSDDVLLPNFTPKSNKKNKDKTAPVFESISNVTQQLGPDECGVIVNYVDPVANDNMSVSDVVNNGGAEQGNLSGWHIISNGGNGWGVTGSSHSGDKAFITSYNWCKRSQTIDLVANGISTVELDKSPKISVSEWFRWNSRHQRKADKYRFKVSLLNSSKGTIVSYDTGEKTFSKKSWVQELKEFTNYNTGVRYIYIEDWGKDGEYWRGHYGPYIDDLEVLIEDVSMPVEQIVQVAGLASGSLFPVGRTTNTFTATDAAGNVGTVSFDVIVEDMQNPTFVSTPEDKNVDGIKPQVYADYASFESDGGEVTDNCGVDFESFSHVSDEIVSHNPELIHRKYSIADNSGNSIEYVQSITVNLEPEINDFNPKSACANTNSDITITGTALANATEVKIGNETASIKSNSAIQIVVSLPADAITGPISVKTAGGTDTSTPLFTVNPLPSDASSISGTTIVLPGDTKTYVCDPINDATSYEWNLDGELLTTVDPQLDYTFTGTTSPGEKDLTVKGVNECGEGNSSAIFTILVRYNDPCETTIVNWDFNEPDLGTDDWQGYATVNGWQSSLNNIEIWSDKMPNVPAGEQCCELNSTGLNQMWQNVFTVPGDIMRWSISYRYRSNASESIQIKIGESGSWDKTFTVSNVSGESWVTHSGLYTVPDGQTTTQFRIVAVSPNSGSGNLIDNIRFYPVEADKEKPTFDSPASSSLECIEATTVIVDHIGVGNLADNCTGVDDLNVEYKIENTSYSDPLVNYGDDPVGDANSENASGYSFPLGLNTVTYRVTDKSGNYKEESFTINITQKPSPIGIFND